MCHPDGPDGHLAPLLELTGISENRRLAFAADKPMRRAAAGPARGGPPRHRPPGQDRIRNEQQLKSDNDLIAVLTKEIEGLTERLTSREYDTALEIIELQATIAKFKETDIVLTQTMIRNEQQLKSDNDLIAVLMKEVKGLTETLASQEYDTALEIIELQATIAKFKETDIVIDKVVALGTTKLEERDERIHELAETVRLSDIAFCVKDELMVTLTKLNESFATKHTKMCVLAGKAQATIVRLENKVRVMILMNLMHRLEPHVLRQLVRQWRLCAQFDQEAKDTSSAIALATTASDGKAQATIVRLENQLVRQLVRHWWLCVKFQAKIVLLQEAEETSSAIALATTASDAAYEQREYDLRCELEKAHGNITGLQDQLETTTVVTTQPTTPGSSASATTEERFVDLKRRLDELK